MWLTVVSVLMSILLVLFMYLKWIRYGSSREVILNLFCLLQGRRSLWVRDPATAHRVLQASSAKGLGVEQLISYHGFSPVLSLESVDGDLWSGMKKNFTLLRAQLPPLQDLAAISSSISKQYLAKYDTIDSPRLSRIVFFSMLKWIFDVDEGEAESESLDFVLESVEQWRMELAIKGKGDMVLKSRTVDWMKELIASSKYASLFGDKWTDPEYWSLLLQPFFISPIINITDIAVTLATPVMIQDFQKGSWSESLFVKAINLNHPFPVLERWFPDGLPAEAESGHQPPTNDFLIQPNTHVFLPMDAIGSQLVTGTGHHVTNPSCSWAAFGAGKRACAGRDIASTLSGQIFSCLMASAKFRPSEGHVHSGRDNDSKESLSESLFQVEKLFRILWTLLRKRLSLRAPLMTPSSYAQIASKQQKFKNPSLLL